MCEETDAQTLLEVFEVCAEHFCRHMFIAQLYSQSNSVAAVDLMVGLRRGRC